MEPSIGESGRESRAVGRKTPPSIPRSHRLLRAASAASIVGAIGFIVMGERTWAVACVLVAASLPAATFLTVKVRAWMRRRKGEETP